MALILNIDTSTSLCSVCLAEDGILIAEKKDDSGNKHASLLTVLIEQLFKDASLNYKDIDAIAVSGGPGSYTGLRIGTSVAKGLCYALDKPLIAVSTLQALAFRMVQEVKDDSGIYIPMIDARRMDVYAALFFATNERLKDDFFMTIDEPSLRIFDGERSIYFGGTGAEKVKKITNINFGTVIEKILCNSSNMCFISYFKYKQDVFENTTYYEPFYFKEFEGRTK